MGNHARSIFDEIGIVTHNRKAAKGEIKRGIGSKRLAPKVSARAQNLWRSGQGSSSVVFKKIARGGTNTPQQLGGQLDYLFDKSSDVFGNGSVFEAGDANIWGRGGGSVGELSPTMRKELIEDWAESWRGSPKNGQTSHLLLSFPSYVDPTKARVIAETFAHDMFASREIVDDEWKYVAAIHTDRAHPHAHIVVNNRGMYDDEWFYMAKDRAFNLQMMKEHVVKLAAEQGVFLDTSTRIERGIMSYGPTREAIEIARATGQEPYCKPLEGGALSNARAQLAKTIDVYHALADIAGVANLDNLQNSLNKCATFLQNGDTIPDIRKETIMNAEEVRTYGDLREYFGDFVKNAEAKIIELPIEEQAVRRREFETIAGELASTLGDYRAPKLLSKPAETSIYGLVADEGTLPGEKPVKINAVEMEALSDDLSKIASENGIDPDNLAARTESGASSAYQERDWIMADIETVADKNSLDLSNDTERMEAASIVDNIYDVFAARIEQSRQAAISVDIGRLASAINSVDAINQEHGRVEFEHDDQAAAFAADLKSRYGSEVFNQLASGDDSALEIDFPDPEDRRDKAMAILEVAKSHDVTTLTVAELDVGIDDFASRKTEAELLEEAQEQSITDEDGGFEL